AVESRDCPMPFAVHTGHGRLSKLIPPHAQASLGVVEAEPDHASLTLHRPKDRSVCDHFPAVVIRECKKGSRSPTGFFSRGWMLSASPVSIVTARTEFGTVFA